MNNNVLEFFVRMKDMMSGGLAKLAQTSNSTFAKIKNDIRGAEKESEFLNHSVGELRARLRDVNKVRFGTVLKSEFKAATAEAKNLEAQIARINGRGGGARAGGRGGGMFGGLMNFARPLMAAASIGAMVSFANSSVKAANQFDAQRTSYEVLAGNKGIGSQLADDLRGLKENTIMGAAVYKNAQTMMGFGVQAKDVVKDLRELGAISMGNADRLQHLTLAFSEVRASGKLTGKELRQFVNAGFNPLAEISRITGKNMAAVRDEMHKGGITFDMLNRAMDAATSSGGRFNGMLEKMAATTQGKEQLLSGQWASFKIALGERMQGGYGMGVDSLSGIVRWAKELVEIPVTQKIQEQIIKIRALQSEITSTNISHQRQIDILHELEQINPNITRGISEQAIQYSKLAQNIDNVTGSLRAKALEENLTKDNKKLLNQYQDLQKDAAMHYANAMALVAKYPDLAQNTALSDGIKIARAKQRLQNEVMAEGDYGGVNAWGRKNSDLAPEFRNKHAWYHNKKRDEWYRLNDESEANMNYSKIQWAISGYNEAMGKLNELQPKVNEFNKTKSALLGQFDQFAGIKSMSAADIQNHPEKDTKATASEADNVASGITSGGPRVITINGVKFTDKIEIHAGGVNEGLQDAERKLEDMFLRILNSGASIQ